MIEYPHPIVTHNDLPEKQYELALETHSVGIDIETSGLDWEHDSLATIQLAIPHQTKPTILIVKPGYSIPDNILGLLNNHDVEKVFHHAMFDLRFLSHHLGAESTRIVCTKIASKLLHPNANKHSLKGLLATYLDIELDKSLKKSDWLVDELTDDQLRYAANDVRYLHRLKKTLLPKLEKKGLLELAEACFRHIPTRVQLDIRHYGDVFTY